MKMLKYFDYVTTFAEFKDEISLCINISNCPGTCESCSESWLRDDIGTVLTNEEIDKLINNHPGITLFGLMGGDSNQDDVVRIANYIHTNYPNIKVGMYSGREYLSTKLLNCLDVYKIGRFILPKGPVEDWHKTNCGVIQFPFSNQLYFEKIHNEDGEVWVNATHKFRKEKINNYERFIIKPDEE